MALLSGILLIGAFVALIALLKSRTRGNLVTFVVALVLAIIAAAITGNMQ